MKTKKYQIGGSTQSRTSSDELNPFKIKEPIAPIPSFVPSGSMNRAQEGVEIQKLSKDGNTVITTKNGTTTTKPNAYRQQAEQYANEKNKLNAEYQLAKEKAKAKAKVKLAEYKGEIPPMKKGGQMKKSKKY